MGVPADRTWTREGVGVVNVTPELDARNGPTRGDCHDVARVGSRAHYREVSGYLVGSAAFKAVGMGDPHPAGSIPVHLR